MFNSFPGRYQNQWISKYTKLFFGDHAEGLKPTNKLILTPIIPRYKNIPNLEFMNGTP